MTAIKPIMKLSVSDWASEYRILSSESSPESGKWNNDRAKYQVGMMDSINESGIETIILMCSAQVGKTELLNNMVASTIDQDPCPILVIQPTTELAKGWSRERLMPMISDTKILHSKISPSKSRDGENTILNKKFSGGHLAIVGANAPSGLASRPIRMVLCDEVDRYPLSAGTEGDPVNLAIKRTNNFHNRKILLVSTPTIKGMSRIETAFESSDMRFFFVKCLHCGHRQRLLWENIKFNRDHEKNLIKDSVSYQCSDCGGLIPEKDKSKLLSTGEWQSTKKSVDGKTAGFHISELYSPWVTWTDLILNFLKYKSNIEMFKTWVNTSLGETWEERGEYIPYKNLYDRRETYEYAVPDGVYYLTAGVDIQGDRIEVEVVGWGYGYESWGIEYAVFHGDPSFSDVWEQLDDFLSQEWQGKHIKYKITRTFVDTGGSNTQQVYDYVSDRVSRSIYGIKGVGGQGQPIFKRKSSQQRAKSGKKLPLFLLGVDNGKSTIYGWLSTTKIGEGYCHFPLTYDLEYFKMLTAEEFETKFERGLVARKWKKIRPRNEALDCRVYALSAMTSLNPKWDKIKENFDRIVLNAK